jgi:acyl-coenzyme A thioesterase 13
VVSLKVEPEHCNMYGTLHGGLSAVLVDSISTLALMPDDEKTTPRFGVSVDMHLRLDYILTETSSSLLGIS